MSVIRRIDLIDDNAFNWPEEYRRKLEQLIQTSKKVAGNGGTRQSLDQLAQVQKQLSRATEQSTKEYIEQKAALDLVRKSNREAVKDINAQTNSYTKLSRRLDKTRNEYKDLAAQGKANTRQAKELRREAQRLDAQLKKIDSSVGQNQRSVGKYTNALKGLGARFLATVGVATALFALMRSGAKIVLNYSKANSNLNAIMNKGSKETKVLRDQQLQLGKATAFSATQVAKAQTELARLGLSMSEITSLTPAILDAAVSLGVDMADAAELVAGNLNAFNLAAKEGKRVSDVLVRATQISAFNYERLSTSLAIVGPAAKAVGTDIERTTAILSAAVDANIDASTAATALRNIFIELSNKGLTWNQAMSQIKGSTDSLKTAYNLFGKRGAVVAQVIANNTEKIDENTIALENATGAANKFAKEALDNLSGDLVLLTSAWEGMILAFEQGDGLIARVVRGTIQQLTADLQQLSDWAEGITPRFRRWRDSVKEMNLSSGQLEAQINMLNTAMEKEREIVEAGNRSRHSRVKGGYIDAKKNLEGYQEQLEFLTGWLEETKKKELQMALALKTNEDAVEDNEEAWKNHKKTLDNWLKKYNEIKGLGSPFELSNDQKNLLKLTEVIFGEATIDEDAKQFLSKIDETIKKVGESYDKARESKLKKDKEAQERYLEIATEGLNAASEIFGQFTGLRIEQISNEMDKLEFERNRELEAVEDNEAAKFLINKEFDQKRRDLEKRQVALQKASSLFQIAVNIAVGISKTIAQLGLPAGIPFIAIAAALGLAQSAAVLAAPVPQLDSGSENTPENYIAGEKRTEFRKSKGKWSVVDKPTLFTKSKGDKIIGGAETDSILGTMADLNNSDILSDKDVLLSLLNNEMAPQQKNEYYLEDVLRENNEKLINTIKNKKSVDLKVTTRGVRVREKSGNFYVDRIDYYYRR
jgi:hypothetical protein